MSFPSSDPDRRPTNDEPTNPFVAFRRFADSQMSSLVNNVFGIFQSSPIRRQQAIDDYESMLNRYRETTRDQHDPEPRDQIEREAEEARRVMDIYIRANQDNNDDARPTRASCEEEEEDDDDDDPVAGMRCPCRPADSFGSLDQMLRPSSINIAYIFMSPYSPLALERQEIFREHSGKMRAAFADLMAIQEGDGLLPNNTIEKHAQLAPAGWAANMGRMMVFGRAKMWDDAYERENWPGPLSVIRLLAKFGRIREEIEGGNIERGDDDDDNSDENPVQHALHNVLRGKRRACELVSLVRDVCEQVEDETEEEVEQGFVREDHIEDETEADDNHGPCLCLHCRNYERRKEEFRQWRREELEEEKAEDEEDYERTTNPTSELDQYHTLADYQAYLLKHEEQNKASSERAKSEGTGLEKQGRPNNKPSILSTLTTTEQRTLPDGSVTTKVVLKKRFSDGGEEVTERVHTQNAPLPQKTVAAETPVAQDTIPSKGKNEKKAGWFWS